MANPGFVDLDVQYTDINSQLGVAVDWVLGKVYNSKGEEVDEVVPDPVFDQGHVKYAKVDYDIQDLSKFAGEPYAEVVWQAAKAGIAIPDLRKRYWFDPAGRHETGKTYVRWDPPTDPNKPVLFYNVYRCRDGDTDVFVGKSLTNFLINDEEFVSEFDARSWKYYAKAVYHEEGQLQVDGSDYMERDAQLTPTDTVRTSLSFCMIEGRILDIMGGSGRLTTDRGYDTIVAFRQNKRDRFQIDQENDAFYLPEDVYVQLNDDGSFAAPLVQDIVAEIHIIACRFRARFVVPNLDRVGFGELDLTILRGL
jgi:hypothetical protein